MHMLLQTIEPAPESFDVVIVDEASQSGPEAMVLAYMKERLDDWVFNATMTSGPVRWHSWSNSS